MAFDFKKEEDVKDYIDNLGIEYRFSCYQEKNAEACHLLGDYLEAIKKDFEKAGKIYKTNCDEYNFGKSCYKFGNYTLIGKGSYKQDHDTAKKYYLKGCDLGYADACLNSGLMCVSKGNSINVKKDYTKGLELLNKGCDAKNSFCCYYLSGMFISGNKDANIEKDMKKAFHYSTRACEMGNMYACANLSRMYSKGEGVTKDENLAEKYKKRALEMQDDMKNQKELTFQEGIKPI